MRYVFAIECSIFVLAIFALAVALVARVQWRWFRMTFALISAVSSLVLLLWCANADSPYKRLNTMYPTLMACAWGSLAAICLGATLFPAVGFWRRGVERAPIARAWRSRHLMIFLAVWLVQMALTIAIRDIYVQKWIARVRADNDRFIASVSPPRIAPEDDAAPAYLDIYREMLRTEHPQTEIQTGAEAENPLPAGSEMPEWLSTVWQPAFDVGRADVLAFRKRHRSNIAAAIAASQRPRASLRPADSIAIEERAHAAMDALRALRSLVVLEARVQARAGNVASCCECLSCLGRLQIHASSQADIFWGQFGRSLEFLRSAVAEAVLSEPAFDAGSLPIPLAKDRFSNLLSAADASSRTAAEMLELACASDLGELDENSVLFSDDQQRLLKGAWPVRSAFAVYHRVFVLADGLASLPFDLRRYRRVAHEMPYEQSRPDTVWMNDFFYPPTSELASFAWFVPPTEYLTGAAAEAQRRLTGAGLAVACFRARNRRDPSSLAELVPDFLAEIPIDPWGGQPLRMRHVDDGIVVYSIGYDKIDDGGIEFPENAPPSPDQTFCLGGAYRKRRIEAAAKGEGSSAESVGDSQRQ